MGLEKTNEHHKKNKHHACKMSTDDVAAAITSLEKQGMIKDVAGAWIRTDKENRQPALM